MMRPRTFTPALVWLALSALAAQGFGAPALIEACQCDGRECSQPNQEMACCEDAVHSHVVRCGQSCLPTPSSSPLGSCCCQETAPNGPAQLPKSDKGSPDRPFPDLAYPVGPSAAPSASPSVILLAEIRPPSPPARILYCVWRI